MSNKKLKHVISYILERDEDQAAKARELLDILFLLDWKSAITREGKTISKSKWHLKSGTKPDSQDFWGALNSKCFVVEKSNLNGDEWTIKFIQDTPNTDISNEEKSIIDFVQNYLISNNIETDYLVSKTYPVFTNTDGSENEINLENASIEYISKVRSSI